MCKKGVNEKKTGLRKDEVKGITVSTRKLAPTINRYLQKVKGRKCDHQQKKKAEDDDNVDPQLPHQFWNTTRNCRRLCYSRTSTSGLEAAQKEKEKRQPFHALFKLYKDRKQKPRNVYEVQKKSCQASSTFEDAGNSTHLQKLHHQRNPTIKSFQGNHSSSSPSSNPTQSKKKGKKKFPEHFFGQKKPGSFHNDHDRWVFFCLASSSQRRVFEDCVHVCVCMFSSPLRKCRVCVSPCWFT